jgi:purine-binding chemotaxis protein CheW
MENTSEAPDSELSRLGGKYLTFFLGEEEYGVDVLFVQEIISMVSITHVPQTPPFVKGVINLRGLVIPVVDLRLKFNMEERKYDKKTCIMVVEINGPDDKKQSMGLIIDKISEVLTIEPEEVDPPPEFGTNIKTEFIIGIAKKGETIKILLDINSVLSNEEMNAINHLSKA